MKTMGTGKLRVLMLLAAVIVLTAVFGGGLKEKAYAAEDGKLYVAKPEALTLNGPEYAYPEDAEYDEHAYFASGSYLNPVYICFKYGSDEDKLEYVTDPAKLTVYLDRYDEESDREVYTKVGAESVLIEKAYDDSPVMKVTYKGGAIEFSNEYVITYDGALPSDNWEENIQIGFSHAYLSEIALYSAPLANDKNYVSEIRPAAGKDIKIYAITADVSDMIFWNIPQSVDIKNVTLIDEDGNDLSKSVVISKDVTVAAQDDRKIIFAAEITIPGDTITAASELNADFEITSIGGDGQERTYGQTCKIYLPCAKAVKADSAKKENTVTLAESEKAFSRSKDLKAKKTVTIKASDARGKITYSLDAKAKKAGIKVSKKGKVTVPKKCKKGTYTVAVRAAGDDEYEAAELTFTIKVRK